LRVDLLIDSHCHLNYSDFAADFDEVLQAAEASGVGLLQTICTTMLEFEAVHALTAHKNIYCSVGVHPHNADKEPLVSVDELVTKAQLPKVIGIGETGLDYFYEYSNREAQKASFINHITAARLTGLPLIVHSRDADDDCLAILQNEMKNGAFPLLIHCFTASRAFGEAVVEMGGYISLSGIITFKKAELLQETVRHLPLERLLIETDAPYLAPIPHRGQRNQPAYVQHVCLRLAELKGVSIEECARITTDNFHRLFNQKISLVNQ
jgi:TatD DNase family protein